MNRYGFPLVIHRRIPDSQARGVCRELCQLVFRVPQLAVGSESDRKRLARQRPAFIGVDVLDGTGCARVRG